MDERYGMAARKRR